MIVPRIGVVTYNEIDTVVNVLEEFMKNLIMVVNVPFGPVGVLQG